MDSERDRAGERKETGGGKERRLDMEADVEADVEADMIEGLGERQTERERERLGRGGVHSLGGTVVMRIL